MLSGNKARIKDIDGVDRLKLDWPEPIRVPAGEKSAALDEPSKIRQRLLQALEAIPDFESCSLLDYPLFFNAGDHIIWLALVRWVQEVRKAKILYVSNPGTFSYADFQRDSQKSPILFTGGGNLGDLWQDHQRFREMIIERYHDRPVIIMPQSIFFKDPAKLERARRIFNAHPDLTIFARENTSFELAQKYFDQCKVVKAPDIAFYLADRMEAAGTHPGSRIFLHWRDDQELANALHQRKDPKLRQVVFGDWNSFNKLSRPWQKMMRKFPALAEFWGRPSFQSLLVQVPEGQKKDILETAEKLASLPRASFHLRSLDFVVQATRQMAPFRLVISNRLHGHILCTLMRKPNVLLANAYHKNEAFYKTWTSEIPSTAFLPHFSLNDLIQYLNEEPLCLREP